MLFKIIGIGLLAFFSSQNLLLFGQDHVYTKQQKIDWLGKNVTNIHSIDPQNEDFSDLLPLKNTLKNTKIVMLGEQTHGDGATFLAKARIVKFLHKEMGFDIIAFESGIYDCRKTWSLLQNGEQLIPTIKKGIFGIWSKSKQVAPLFNYIGETIKSDNPLELAGFDCQFSYASADYFVSDLEDFLIKVKIPTDENETWFKFKSLLQISIEDRPWKYAPTSEEKDLFLNYVKNLQTALDTNKIKDSVLSNERVFWQQILKSSKSQVIQQWKWASQKWTRLDWAVRDKQMGENLVWLSNTYYPNRKIIVWAATAHIIQNLNTIEWVIPIQDSIYSYDEKTVTMGQIVKQKLGNQVYTLGFTAYQGEAGRWEPYGVRKLPKSTEGSLEELMNLANLNYALLDFRHISNGGEWLLEKLISRPCGNSEWIAIWPNLLDGILFTKEMFPSTKNN